MKEIKHRILRNYTTPSGVVPFEEWINSLKDSVVRHRIRTRLDRVEKGNLGIYKPLGDGVSELKFDFGSGYRIYFAEEGDIFIILLCGGDKSSQKKDIKIAKAYWKELLERCDE